MRRDRNGELTDGGGARVRWVKKFRESGLGLKEFARRHGLKPGQLHYWVYQSSKPPGTWAQLPPFQEVRLPARALTGESWSTEIGLPNGTTVRLARETDVAWATALIDFLRRS
jgi:hypothetical protein